MSSKLKKLTTKGSQKTKQKKTYFRYTSNCDMGQALISVKQFMTFIL